MSSDEYQRLKEPKACFVPTCTNTDVKNPGLRFFSIRKELKKTWCLLVNRNCPRRSLFCCGDHLNLEEDLDNYEKYLSGANPRLKLNATLKNIPRKLDDSAIQGHTSRTVGDATYSLSSSALDIQTPNNADAAVQCESVVLIHRSVMAKPNTENKSTNFQARKTKEKIMPSLLSHLPENEESPCPSPSLFGSSNFDSNSSSSGNKYDEKVGRNHLMKMIKNKPKMNLGLPKNSWWSIDFIGKECSCLALHIILTLFKIKNNDTFERMSDEFEVARSTIRLIFEKTVFVLAPYLKKIIYLPSLFEIKKNLPLVFKIRYSNVQVIIDCFEIQIEKPSDPARQAQTWSQYKSCNTIKYLIGCTPAGLIAFISKGFGGRISDKAITRKSGFIDILPLNAVIMADRGFKEIEALLSTKNVKLLRPPSVLVNKNLTKKEVIQTKVIASLRVHIERVIRRVREFHMLKPHSVVNHKHLKYLDELVVISCGLVNMQDPIIKSY